MISYQLKRCLTSVIFKSILQNTHDSALESPFNRPLSIFFF
jgi:hypothetical protein